MNTLHLFISGVVQGVGYRAFMSRTATELGVVGWVRNLPDGRVEVVAVGPRSILDQLLPLAYVGPEGAQVTNIEVLWEEIVGEYLEFKILS